MAIPLNMIGFKNDYFEVIDYAGTNKRGENLWKSICSCSNLAMVTTANLNGGYVKSCGNLEVHPKTHGLTKRGAKFHPVYRMWCNMKNRCYNPEQKTYPYYKGKGIVICEEWKNDARVFFDWAMSNGWKEGLSIDRIDSSSNYEPSNCRFITRGENSRNSLKAWQKRSGQNLICSRCDNSYYRMKSKVSESKFCTRFCRFNR